MSFGKLFSGHLLASSAIGTYNIKRAYVRVAAKREEKDRKWEKEEEEKGKEAAAILPWLTYRSQ